jgi:tetratricopeptide (TPR) repeat protein
MTPRPPALPAGSRSIPEPWFVAALFALVFLAYQPVFQAGFIWDDDAHVTAPALRSWSGLARIWIEPGATQQYYPLLHSLFWVEHRLWGHHPPGYHLVNLALHAAAAGLFYLLLRRLKVPWAWLAAALFALHPVHVESVAWISEQKNTLSAIFYLGAALAWLRFEADRSPRSYLIASGLFVLGLLTKTVVATLPAALLVLGWWRHGRVDWRRDVRPLLPWFLLGAVAGLFTAVVERHLIGAEGVAFDLTVAQRCLLAGRALCFYLGKLAWPVDLMFIYPRQVPDAGTLSHWLPLVLVVSATIALWTLRRRARAPLAVWLLFAGSLFPVLGFLNVYPFLYSFVADHFSYLASLGLIAFAAAGVARLPRPLGAGAAAGLLLVLGLLTWRQSGTYRNAETLYRTTLDRNPDCWMAWNNLGHLQLGDRTRTAEALASFEAALRLRPEYPEARGNLGLALTQAGRAAEAVPHLQESLRLKPGQYQMYNNLGIALATSGRSAESLAAFGQAAALNPALPNIQENWGKALLLLNRRAEAAEHFARAEKLRAPPVGTP